MLPLGSMTQFVSFSQDPANSAILLGGTQDNGSPATSRPTQTGEASMARRRLQRIDPSNPNKLVHRQYQHQHSALQRPARRAMKVRLALWSIAPIWGADSGAFYAPYILIPKTASELIVGTCRVGVAARRYGVRRHQSQLDAGFATICADPRTSVVNFVRAIAAGGPHRLQRLL